MFGYQHPWQAEAWFHHRGGLQMLRQAYAKYNAYPVGVSWWGVESVVSKKPINKMDDFKGVKFRSPQGMTAEILTKLGASIVVLPGGEVYSALDKGVVDAADWATISMNQRMGFHEVAKFPTKLFHSMPVQEFTVNMEAWKKLPDDIKAIVSTSVREWTWDQVQRVAVDDARVTRELAGKGVTAAILGRRGDGQDPRTGGEDLGGMVEEDAARQAGLRLADWPGSRNSRSSLVADEGSRERPARRHRAARPLADGSAMRSTGSTPGSPGSGACHLLVTVVILYEVVARGVFGQATIWANETTIYLSACAYLLSGGYALAHRRHVRIDLIYDRLSPRTPGRLDVFTFVFFVIYVGALIWVGPHDGLEFVPSGRRHGHALEPAHLAGQVRHSARGLLLLLQGIANLLRELGMAQPERAATT